MSDLAARFTDAIAQSRQLDERPDNATLLRLYGLYKQGSSGDNIETKPGFSDPMARAKWEAWTALKGMTTEQAQQRYVDLIEELN